MESAPRESAFDLAEYVPHRPPILGLDALLVLEDARAVARREVRPGPDVDAQGALWEAALIEGIAQTAAAMHGAAARRRGRGVLRGMLVGLSRFSIERLPKVGEVLEYEVSLVRELDAISLVHGQARVAGEVLAAGDFQFFTEQAGPPA